VWEVLTDVERWPERIETVTSADRLDSGPLTVGSRARLVQPRLPPAEWTVTHLVAGSSFTWESRSPAVRIVAGHVVEPAADGTRLTLSIDLAGPMAWPGWLMTRSLTKRYVATEAASIKRVAEEA
jgi:hypothetical protein